MTAAQLRFGLLVSETVSLLKRNWVAIIVGNIIAMCLIGIPYFFMIFSVLPKSEFGLTIPEEGMMQPPAMGMEDAMPFQQPQDIVIFIIGMLLIFVISLVVQAYMVLLATERVKSLKEGIRRAPTFIIPLILMAAWTVVSFVRSFWYILLLWLLPILAFASDAPGLGSLLMLAVVVVHVFMALHFALAPFILIGEGATPRKSVEKSKDRVRPAYARFLGNFVGMIVCLFVVQLGAMLVFAIVLGLGTFLGSMLGSSAMVILGVLGVLLLIAFVLFMFLLQQFPMFFLARMSAKLKT